MVEVPSLITLCLDATKNGILRGEDVSQIYELPSELFDSLLPRLPPLALLKLQDELPLGHLDDHEVSSNLFQSQRKRKRCENFDVAWRILYMLRWPGLVHQIQQVDWYKKQDVEMNEFEDDWQQIYWETHIQNCLDAAAEVALLPHFEGSLGRIKMPDALLKFIGCERFQSNSESDCSMLSYHCKQFGLYARCVRLQNVLCHAETSHLLRYSKLKGLELQWVKSRVQVEGVCRLLNQNQGTLTSVEFIHCKLSSAYVNAICDSLCMKGLQTHGIQHFSVNTSRFLDTNSSSIPFGLVSFLSSARSLSKLSICDSHFQQNSAKMVFTTLLDASSSIAILDLSENNISGWLSHFKWGSSNHSQLTLAIDKSLKSLCVLNLRSNNLLKDDADCLRYALIHMPSLENLDLSDNPIDDDGIKSLCLYFAEISERCTPFVSLNLKNCELSWLGVSQLLQVLSTFKEPLNALSIGDNNLGSKVGVPLGKFLCTGIKNLDFKDIGLDSSGFLDAQEQLMEGIKIISINMSQNKGGMEAAKFLSKLILRAPDLVEVNAGYNLMPVESLSVVCSCLEVAKGKLERVDLTGNSLCGQPANLAHLTKFQVRGKPVVVAAPVYSSTTPYDDDP